ncbi:hypothetical protein BaRGS_00018600 [Batillaria attramentaria]|uniref:Uncharacterized protein n=1 Tax=Batillaria attramentaria TaxID=370345 RepID=A0ABD0KSU7_9CAEN
MSRKRNLKAARTQREIDLVTVFVLGLDCCDNISVTQFVTAVESLFRLALTQCSVLPCGNPERRKGSTVEDFTSTTNSDISLWNSSSKRRRSSSSFSLQKA